MGAGGEPRAQARSGASLRPRLVLSGPRPAAHPPSVTGAGLLRSRSPAAARSSGGAGGSGLGSSARSGGGRRRKKRRRRRKAPGLSAAITAAAARPPLATARLPGSAGHHGSGAAWRSQRPGSPGAWREGAPWRAATGAGPEGSPLEPSRGRWCKVKELNIN